MKAFLRLAALAALVLGAAPAAAQFQFGDQHASTSLYTRVEDGLLRAAIEIDIDLGWHLYHVDKGPGVGKPMTVELGGRGLSWSEIVYPEPHRHDQPAVGDQPATYVLAHEGKIVLFASARFADEESAAGAFLDLDGLTCENGPMGTCVPYAEAGIEPSGPGSDALWTDFPTGLVPAREDEHEMGDADATLYTRIRDGKVLAALSIEIDEDAHLFHDELNEGAIALPTVVTMAGDGIAWGDAAFPEPEEIEQLDGYALGHHGTIVVHVEGQLAAGATPGEISARLEGQTCESGPAGVCIRYVETAYSRGEGEDALFEGFGEAAGTSTASYESHGAAEEAEDEGLLAFLGLAIFWGLFTLLMPCTYPMIPITISFFTKQADARGGNVLPLSLVYGAGIVLIFILIGVVIGGAIIPFAQHPITNLVIAGFFVVFALALFGLINLSPPAKLMNLAGKASMTGGYLGVFLMGACLVITSFTCTAPFVGSLLSVGAADGDLGRIVLGMGTFGLTMAIPFVILSLVPGKIAAMPKSGEWMNTLKVTLGFVELAAALKFLSNADLVWEWDLISRELFLALWIVIFTAAAVYLLFFAGGQRAAPSSGRALAGVALACMAGYFGYGFAGKTLDPVMTSIVPPYSGGRFFPELWRTGARHQIVVDDYDAAVELARQEGKLVLVNFTGHT
ncbi:MAG: cytochrome c biogenesis protein CcdA [Planctomycetota bacterium]